MTHKYLFNIATFDGEGGSAAASTGAVSGGTSQVAAGDMAQSNGSMEQAVATPTDNTGTFDDYMKSHKDEAEKWFQDKFNRRHRDYNDLKVRLKATDSVMDMLAVKFGIEDRRDVKAITEALQKDDYLYAQRAEENGRSIEEQREWDELDRENRMFREQQRRVEQQEQMQNQVSEWQREAANLKQIFPNFDLEAELENEEFYNRLLRGDTVASSFYALHGEEIAAGAMQYTAQAVRQATAQEIASKGRRPSENGLSGQAAARVVGKDFSHMTLEELRRYGKQHAIR